ncbi:MAG: hypothetical protein RL007_2243 [Bacteroidota bacterium]|jgi:hypothetical protein
MALKLSSIFENTIGNVLSSLVLLLLLPAATAVQVNTENKTGNEHWYLAPTFLASILIGIFLIILFQFCRRLYIENIKLQEKTKKLETFLISIHFKTDVQGKIAAIRNRALFVKQFDNIEYFRLPGETDEQLWERLPEGGLYRQHLYDEYLEVRKWLETTYKEKSGKDFDYILRRFYPKEFIEPIKN